MDCAPASLGARLRHYRRKAGLTQDRLAELSGVSRNTIDRAENGHTRKLQRRIYEPLAHAMGLLAADLRCDDGQTSPTYTKSLAGLRMERTTFDMLTDAAELDGVTVEQALEIAVEMYFTTVMDEATAE